MDAFIKQITKEAGEVVGKKFGKIGVKYTKKDSKDVVTEADLAANKIITDAIKKKYPAHSIISEETGEELTNSEYCWIIDPLDGTLNFATNVPLFGTMVGLAHKGEMILAAMYFPMTKELLYAKRGKGAFLNGKRIHCSEQKKREESYGIIDVHVSKNAAVIALLSKYNSKGICYVGAFGSAAVDVLYVATGRRDWVFIRHSAIWDRAMGALILEEAGCKVTKPDGTRWSINDQAILATNKYLHKTLSKIVSEL